MATGPSLDVAQIEYVRAFHAAGLVKVFGCNDLYRICDYLDVLYACDPQWWNLNPEALKHPCPQKWTQDQKFGQQHNIYRVHGGSGKGLCTEPNRIHFGSNSGFQLMNLAWHFGVRKFILLGYNMDVPKGKDQHFFGKHPKGLNQSNNYRSFVSMYRQIDVAIRKNVVNCTIPTALDCFEQKPLHEVLRQDMIPTKVDIPEAPRDPTYYFLGDPIART